MDHNKQRTYFAAANTAEGFQNYFPQIFDRQKLDKIFILKGGPGTGKSSFMRIISKIAQEKGYGTEEFLCSSDPKSLDGIIIPELGLAVLDGTAPHTFDPIYPGVVESIINTGVFWDREKLCKDKSGIIFLIQNKKRYFKRAYHFLKAWGEIELEILKIGEKALLRDKMNQSIDRILRQFQKDPERYEEHIRLQSAINSTGHTHLNTYEKNAKTVFVVEDHLSTSTHYLDQIYRLAKDKGLDMELSYSCLFPNRLDGLYFPQKEICFIIGKRNYESELMGKEYHYVNMKRFLSKDVIQENRQKLKFAKRCSDMLLSGAVEAFGDAATAHNELEKKYIEAMNFKAWEESISSFVEEHLS